MIRHMRAHRASGSQSPWRLSAGVLGEIGVMGIGWVVAGESIVIEVASARAGADLIDTLGRRGLIGKLVGDEENWDVAVATRGEELVRLLAEVVAAVEAWRNDRRAGDLTVRIS
jgi:hypothetical protein